MGTNFKEMPRWAQWLGGGTVLAIAVAAGATGLAINVLHGLEVSLAAAIFFGLADLTKIVLPIVAGIIGWTKQMRITALVCVVVSIWCASNAYLDGAGTRLADKQHDADQYTQHKTMWLGSRKKSLSLMIELHMSRRKVDVESSVAADAAGQQ
jgi:hypothetical protein